MISEKKRKYFEEMVVGLELTSDVFVYILDPYSKKPSLQIHKLSQGVQVTPEINQVLPTFIKIKNKEFISKIVSALQFKEEKY